MRKGFYDGTGDFIKKNAELAATLIIQGQMKGHLIWRKKPFMKQTSHSTLQNYH